MVSTTGNRVIKPVNKVLLRNLNMASPAIVQFGISVFILYFLGEDDYRHSDKPYFCYRLQEYGISL